MRRLAAAAAAAALLAACGPKAPRVEEIEKGVFKIVNGHGTFVYLDDAAAATKGLSGIGVRFEAKPEGFEIVEVFEDGPGLKAGLLPGDLIAAVDGKPTAGLSLEQGIALIRGKPGSPITLDLKRNGREKKAPLHRGEKPFHFTQIAEGTRPIHAPDAETSGTCPPKKDVCLFLIHSDGLCWYSCAR